MSSERLREAEGCGFESRRFHQKFKSRSSEAAAFGGL